MEGIILSILFLLDTMKHHIISIEILKIHKKQKKHWFKKKAQVLVLFQKG
jgi:hypothetical protein